MKKPEKVRINVNLEPEVARELVAIGQSLGLSKTGIVSLATSLGLQALKISRDPKMREYYEKELITNEKK